MTGDGVDRYDQPAGDGADSPRPYIGVHFECCGVYARIYRQHDKMVYLCRCPRCLRQIRVRVGPGGTNARLFHAR